MRLLALVVVLACSSCSLAFVEKVDEGWAPTTEPRCTSSAGPFALDLLAAAANGTYAGYAYVEGRKIADEPGTESEVAWFNTAIAIGGLAAAAYLASAFYGVVQTGRCDEARVKRDLYVEWSAKQAAPPAPAPVAPPPARVDPVTPPAPVATPPPPAPADAGPPPQ